MCYFLYGAINDSVNIKDYDIAMSKSKYHFKPGTKHDLKMCIAGETYGYGVTSGHCDCDFPAGKHNKDAKELIELAELIYSLKDIRNVKHIYISKTWAGEKNKKEATMHIDDIDVVSFLADMEESCLYCIELYKRYI